MNIFICKPDDERYPSLLPDENTEERDFRFAKQEFGSPSLIFTNGWAEDSKRRRISTLTPKVLFDGADIAVRENIHVNLVGLDLPGVYTHPSVYIDGNGSWHEDYWYLTFSTLFDCWDRDTSRVARTALDLGDEKLYQVFTHRLDKKLLERAPLRDRLLFKWKALWTHS